LGLMALAVRVSKEEKLSILMESLEAWNLLGNIDMAVSDIQQLVQTIGTQIDLADDLPHYIQDVKETIKLLSQVAEKE